uniref:Putative terminase n=2 Tax=viral metagenome TaxID=1070528 RepID=A0A6H1ZV44_9ZZZZ
MSTPNKLNARQKLVLMNALKGMTNSDAYEAVYGYSVGVQQRASELFRNINFKRELERLQNKQLEAINTQLLSKTEKRQILADFARAQLIDLIDDNGNIKLNKNSAAARALKEWQRKQHTDRQGNPVTTSLVKLIDPISAIMEDNKMTGDYAPTKSMVAQKVQFEVNVVEKRRFDTLENNDFTD